MAAASLRSNGLILAGFFAYEALVRLLRRDSLLNTAVAVASACFVALPLLAWYSHYTASMYCNGDAEAVRPWCRASFPNIYAFVQREYWNVGFLRYWEIKQIITNFVLALPALALAAASAHGFFSKRTAWKGSLA